MTLFRLLISLAIPFTAAAIGSYATVTNIPNWYAFLDKPVLNPPNFIFGPVWTALYFLIGISLFLFWQRAQGDILRRGFLIFAIQMVLNTAWSLVFFGLRQPWLSLLVIVLLLLSIVGMTKQFRKVSKPAAYLLAPYIVWVSFATYLNAGIALLN